MTEYYRDDRGVVTNKPKAMVGAVEYALDTLLAADDVFVPEDASRFIDTLRSLGYSVVPTAADRCVKAANYHSTPHKGCIMR